MRSTFSCLDFSATPIAYHHPVTEKPLLGLWLWKSANRYYRLTHDHRFEKWTVDGWCPADPYYLWRCWEDPEFLDVSITRGPDAIA
jgi:hypothetical protein